MRRIPSPRVDSGIVRGRDLCKPVWGKIRDALMPDQDHARNPAAALASYGQSLWLDDIRRDLLVSGELETLIERDGLCGVTSNPSIFEKDVRESTEYQDILNASDARTADPGDLYERIALRDIREAAEILRPVYESTDRRDGYVSLEVSPKFARDTRRTLD